MDRNRDAIHRIEAAEYWYPANQRPHRPGKGIPAMKKQFGFSLVEVTIAVGVAAFCLTSLTGLIMTGLHSNEKAEDRYMALNVAATLFSDLKSAPKATNGNSQTVDSVSISEAGSNDDAEQVVYYSEVADSTGSHFANQCSPTAHYRISLSMHSPGTKQHRATFVHLRLTWPAQATPETASGRVEVVSALDRN